MKTYLIYMVLFFMTVQKFHSQEDGVVALNIPVRNSLKFNKYAINPTFSFVREQNKYISFTNKREWVQFDDAPQTYLFSYSGRFRENIGAGIGVFQQNYGVLNTFGGILNFAYNAMLNSESNLTFGLNLGFYKSGINEGNVITNLPDPSLQNISSNALLSISPGLNYGTTFFDFGVSINNLAAYNVTTSTIIKDNPEQSIQGHIMYTGYVNSRGFFDESKFSGLIRSEFKKDITVISGIMMLTVPRGFWGQAGYNSLYGISVGLGFNISNQIAIEYNYEKEIGDLVSFGNSHEFTLAYKFKNRYRYNYSGDDEESALLIPTKKTRRVIAKQRPASNTNARAKTVTETQNNVAEEARLAGLTKEKADAEAKSKLLEAQEQARLAAEAQTRADEEARLAAESKAKAEAQAKLVKEQERAKLAAATQAKAVAAAQAKLLEEQEQARLAAETQARLAAEAEAQAKLLEEQEQARLDEEAEAQAQLLEEQEQARLALQAQSNSDLPPSDETTKSLRNLAEEASESNKKQEELLIKLTETVASREQDLKDLKEENDLSEQGIYTEPKPFKSVTAENSALESLKLQIDNVIKEQNIKIEELDKLYNERLKNVPNKQDSISMIYLKEIVLLKSKQEEAERAKQSLVLELETIRIATEVERKRRIKRATYDNEEARYAKDRATLSQIKQFTPVASESLTVEDFDFGEERSNNIQILKDVKNEENGYYLVIAVHSDVAKRDEFLSKAVAAGLNNINFFYDVTTSKYYIYYEKYTSVEAARNAMQLEGSEPYNAKMSMVRIE